VQVTSLGKKVIPFVFSAKSKSDLGRPEVLYLSLVCHRTLGPTKPREPQANTVERTRTARTGVKMVVYVFFCLWCGGQGGYKADGVGFLPLIAIDR